MNIWNMANIFRHIDIYIIIIIIIIIIIMAEVAFILRGWQPQMKETYMVCNLQLHHVD